MVLMANHFYVEFGNGNCTIVIADCMETARTWAATEFGRRFKPRISRATSEQVEWVKVMGGTICEASAVPSK